MLVTRPEGALQRAASIWTGAALHECTETSSLQSTHLNRQGEQQGVGHRGTPGSSGNEHQVS